MLDENETPLRLLAVEDDPTDRSWLELMLKDANVCPYVMRFVGTMSDAVAALNAREYDCVLLDLSLPDSEGIESVRRVLSTNPSLPIVVFTGRKDQEIGLQSIEAGAQDYLVKGQASGNTILQAARWASVRRRARAVEESREHEIVDRLVEAWVLVGVDLRILRANQAFLQVAGVNETEALGLALAAFLTEESAAQIGLLRRLAEGEVSGSVVAQVDVVHRLGAAVPRTLVATAARSGPGGGDAPIDGLFVVLAAPAPPPPPPPPPPPA